MRTPEEKERIVLEAIERGGGAAAERYFPTIAAAKIV